MRYRPLHILSVVSAVVCVASLLLVGRSFFVVDVARAPIGHDGAVQVWTLDGQLWLIYIHYHLELEYFTSEPPPFQRGRDWLLWQYGTGRALPNVGWGSGGFPDLILPLWLLPLLTAILPVRWWLIRRRQGARGFPVEPKASVSSAATEHAADTE